MGAEKDITSKSDFTKIAQEFAKEKFYVNVTTSTDVTYSLFRNDKVIFSFLVLLVLGLCDSSFQLLSVLVTNWLSFN